jgi:hypothetical protein
VRAAILVRVLCALSALVSAAPSDPTGALWKRHTIDATSRGADGVRLADADGDGDLDVVSGWEEGGVTRVYLNPGPEAARGSWPAVTVGETPSVEDAVFADLDGDGSLDVVTSAEGNARRMTVHWAPRDRSRYLDPEAWSSGVLPVTRGLMAWMFCVPADIDGRAGIDLVAGGKGAGAAVGWLESPPEARALENWKWHPLREAGWIMTLHAADRDGDGDTDIVLSDRKTRDGDRRGAYWLEHPGKDVPTARWKSHLLGGAGREVMFLGFADLDGEAVLAALLPREILILRPPPPGEPRGGEPPDGRDSAAGAWVGCSVLFGEEFGKAKAVAAGDIDQDGRADLAVTCGEAAGERAGIFWLRRGKGGAGAEWEPRTLGGPEGAKYDLVELLDLDGDGDLDALTCEESDNLGVVWYENPAR